MSVSHKKLALALSIMVVAIGVVFAACVGILFKPDYREAVANDFQVEHVTDRIASKIETSNSTTPPLVTLDTAFV